MIIKYGGRNCWCFKEWAEFDFRINRNVPEEYGFNDTRIVPFLCFQGPNASGKSSALKLLTFIKNFAALSFSLDTDSKLGYGSYFHNDEPSDFYMTFSLPGDIEKEYTYRIKATESKVKSESLTCKSGATKTVVFKRIGNKIKENTLFVVNESFILRSNASVISTAHQYGYKEIEPFYLFFSHIYSNTQLIEENNFNVSNPLLKLYYEYPDLLERINKELKRFDTGVENVSIFPYRDEKNNDIFIPFVEHQTDDGAKKLFLYEESTGTIKLFFKLAEIFDTLDYGGVMVADELDCHLHSVIANQILGYFCDFDSNKNHAQLVFTSHDSDFLDVAKKYRCYLFNKESNEAFAYRIDEIKDKDLLRNDKPLKPVYESGIIGGMPDVK